MNKNEIIEELQVIGSNLLSLKAMLSSEGQITPDFYEPYASLIMNKFLDVRSEIESTFKIDEEIQKAYQEKSSALSAVS